MTRPIALNKALIAPVFLIIFAGLLPADSISSDWQQIAPPATLPGNPVDFYTWNSASPFGPNPFDDPGFNLFGQSGGFLFTGNTYYNFIGTPEIALWSSGSGSINYNAPNPGVNSGFSEVPQGLNSQDGAVTPEPAAAWLLGGGLAGLAAWGRYRVRRIRSGGILFSGRIEACSSLSSATLNCSARRDMPETPSQS